jgi:predicted phage terminase large subunit-like protein
LSAESLLNFLPKPEVISGAHDADDLKVSQDYLAELKENAKASLYIFAKGILGYDRFDPSIHRPLCRLLEDPENSRLMIVLPRGWYKTTLATIAYPIWCAVRNPNVRILIVQNTHTNAMAKLKSISDHFRHNQLFRAMFPEILPDKNCMWTQETLTVPRPRAAAEGTIDAAGTRTQLTGRHYDKIIEDDTVAPALSDIGEENVAPTKEDVVQAIGFHRFLVPPLLVHPTDKRYQNIVIGTRWFEKDLISWVKDPENKQHFTTYERSVRENERGESDPEGKITFPAQFSEEALETLEGSMGTYMFSCLYLNKPMRSDQAMFRDDDLQLFHTEPLGLAKYTTVDLATDPSMAKGEVDYNVIFTTGIDMETGNIYVLHYHAMRANPKDVMDELFRQVETYNPLNVGIEAIAYQKSFVHFVKQRQADTGNYFQVTPITGHGRSKGLRIMGLQPYVATHRVFIRQWMASLRTQLIGYPLTAHDDIADAFAMQLELWPTTFRTLPGQYKATPSRMSLDAAYEEIKARKQREGQLIPGTLSDIYHVRQRGLRWQN